MPMQDSGRTLLPRIALPVVSAAVIVYAWILPLHAGYWLDETGTYYIVSGNWSQFLDRMGTAIQSPLHSLLLWAVFHAGFTSELALRLPSLLAMFAGLLLACRIASQLAGAETALLTAVIFPAMPAIALFASQARAYGFVMALSLAALWAYLRWTRTQTLRDILLCAAFTTLAFYTHALAASTGLVVATLALLSILRGRPLRIRHLLLAAALCCALGAPILPYYMAAARDAAIYTFRTPPSVSNVLLVFGFDLLAPALFIPAAAAIVLVRGLKFQPPPLQDDALPLLACCCLMPVAFLLVMSNIGTGAVLLNRYAIVIFAAESIAISILIRCFSHPAIRAAIACAAAILLAVGTFGSLPWSGSIFNDWREVNTKLREVVHSPDTIVFARSGFIDSKTLSRLQQPTTLGFIMAPFAAYPVSANLIATPYTPNDGGSAYLDQRLTPVLASGQDFFYVGTAVWLPWFTERARKHGYQSSFIIDSHDILIYHFIRND